MLTFVDVKFISIVDFEILKGCSGLQIQLFRERLSAKMCTRRSRKVIWDMINTLLQTLQLSKLLLLLSFSTHKHTSMASRAILSNFFEEQRTQNYPQYLSGLSRALFPTTFLEIAVYSKQQMLPVELSSCYVFRQQFVVKRVKCSAQCSAIFVLTPRTTQTRSQVFSVNDALTCNCAALSTSSID